MEYYLFFIPYISDILIEYYLIMEYYIDFVYTLLYKEYHLY